LTATYLKQLNPYIGDAHLDEVDTEVLQASVDDRLEADELLAR